MFEKCQFVAAQNACNPLYECFIVKIRNPILISKDIFSFITKNLIYFQIKDFFIEMLHGIRKRIGPKRIYTRYETKYRNLCKMFLTTIYSSIVFLMKMWYMVNRSKRFWNIESFEFINEKIILYFISILWHISYKKDYKKFLQPNVIWN